MTLNSSRLPRHALFSLFYIFFITSFLSSSALSWFCFYYIRTHLHSLLFLLFFFGSPFLLCFNLFPFPSGHPHSLTTSASKNSYFLPLLCSAHCALLAPSSNRPGTDRATRRRFETGPETTLVTYIDNRITLIHRRTLLLLIFLLQPTDPDFSNHP